MGEVTLVLSQFPGNDFPRDFSMNRIETLRKSGFFLFPGHAIVLSGEIYTIL